MNYNTARSHGFHDAIDGGDRRRFVPDSLSDAYDTGFADGEAEANWMRTGIYVHPRHALASSIDDLRLGD